MDIRLPSIGRITSLKRSMNLSSPAVPNKSFLEMSMMHMPTTQKITFQKNFINLIMQMQISQASMILPEILFLGGFSHSGRSVNTILKEGVDLENCKYLHEDRDKHVIGVTAKPSYPNENASSFNAPPRSPTRRNCNSSHQSPTRRSYCSPVQSPIRRSINAPAQNSFNCPPRSPTHRSFSSPVRSPIARSFNALARGSLNCPPWSPSRGRQSHAQNSFNYPPRSPNHRTFNSPARSPTHPRSPNYRSFNSPVRSPLTETSILLLAQALIAHLGVPTVEVLPCNSRCAATSIERVKLRR